MPELYEQAPVPELTIIVDAEGQEWLNGYRLPPDNDERWQPATYNVAITHCVWNGRNELVDGYVTHEQVTSRITNAQVRESNMRLILDGHAPLFVKWEEIAKSPEQREQEKYARSIRGRIGRLLGLQKATV